MDVGWKRGVLDFRVHTLFVNCEWRLVVAVMVADLRSDAVAAWSCSPTWWRLPVSLASAMVDDLLLSFWICDTALLRRAHRTQPAHCSAAQHPQLFTTRPAVHMAWRAMCSHHTVYLGTFKTCVQSAGSAVCVGGACMLWHPPV